MTLSEVGREYVVVRDVLTTLKKVRLIRVKGLKAPGFYLSEVTSCPAVVTKFLVTLSDEITNMLGLAGPVRIGRAITQVVQARGLLKDNREVRRGS